MINVIITTNYMFPSIVKLKKQRSSWGKFHHFLSYIFTTITINKGEINGRMDS